MQQADTDLVVWCGALQAHDGIVAGRLGEGGRGHALLGHGIERIFLAGIRLRQRLDFLASFRQRLVPHLHWQIVVQVQQAHLHAPTKLLL